MPFHAHFALLNLDTLALKTRLCEVFSWAGYMPTVTKHAMPRYLGVARQLAQNSANPARLSGKARSFGNSSKRRDSTPGNLAYGQQHTGFAVGLIVTLQCECVPHGWNCFDELTGRRRVSSRYAE